MDSEAFRKHGKEMVDIIADYWETLAERKPMPDCKPGFLNGKLPHAPPEGSEDWKDIFSDLEPIVLANNTNWHHPHFFAYYPTACSYQSILGDMLSGAMASVGFTWKSSPSMTELEMKMMDWLVEALGLPEHFRHDHPGPGAGSIQCTASDSTFVAVLAARSRMVRLLKESQSQLDKLSNGVKHINISDVLSNILSNKEIRDDVVTFDSHDPTFFNRLVGYCSDQAHSSVFKGFMLAGVRMRKIPSTLDNDSHNYCIDPEALQRAIKEDRAHGYVPFVLVATLGTTSTCAFDDLTQIGPICNDEKIWLHVDAAYAGGFLLCPEFRWIANGMEMADSFNFNPHKACMINFDCSPLWFKNAKEAMQHFNVDAEYLKHEYQAEACDHRVCGHPSNTFVVQHLQIALGRRFRSLKVWFVLRNFGLENIRTYQRKLVSLAQQFAEMIAKNSNFEMVVPQSLGLVCFRQKGDNKRTEDLLSKINADGRIHLVPGKTDDIFYLRLAVCSQLSTEKDIDFAYKTLCELLNVN